MKIGIDIRNIGKSRTGDEVVFFNLVKNLAQIDVFPHQMIDSRGNFNEYFLFTDIIDENILDSIKLNLGIKDNENFKIVSLKTKNKFTWNFFALSRYLKKKPLDVYHTQYILPFRTPKDTRLITTIHDISFRVYPKMIKLWDLIFLRILIPMSLRKAFKIIAVSEFTKNEIIKYYKIDPKKIEVVKNAVGEDFLKDKTVSESPFAADIISKYSLPQNFILYLGTLQPRKNIPVLIEAWSKIKRELNGTKLLLCGNRESHNFDPKIDDAIKKFSLENEVVFPGFISETDKPALFRFARAFCYPSLYEGFGIPLLEAFASHIPVIASDISAHREVGGEAISYFNPQDSEELSQKIKELILQPEKRSALINSGEKRLKLFSWQESAEKTLKIYLKIY